MAPGGRQPACMVDIKTQKPSDLAFKPGSVTLCLQACCCARPLSQLRRQLPFQGSLRPVAPHPVPHGRLVTTPHTTHRRYPHVLSHPHTLRGDADVSERLRHPQHPAGAAGGSSRGDEKPRRHGLPRPDDPAPPGRRRDPRRRVRRRLPGPVLQGLPALARRRRDAPRRRLQPCKLRRPRRWPPPPARHHGRVPVRLSRSALVQRRTFVPGRADGRRSRRSRINVRNQRTASS